MPKLTKRLIDSLPPVTADTVFWDSEQPGFGLRVRPTGRKVFVCWFRTKAGRARKVTIGSMGRLTVDQARQQARELLTQVDKGQDPGRERTIARHAPVVAELFDRYFAEHAELKKKANTVAKDRRWVTRCILPALGKFKVRDVSRADVAALHHAMRATPYAANRVFEILRKAFNLAEAWGLRPDGTNPCRHVEKYKEAKRERLLTPDELARLGQALDDIEREVSELPSVTSLVRLLVLTGCRLGEIQNLRWEQVDLEAGALRLADSKTGAKVVPLGEAALELLTSLPRPPFGGYVCPGIKENSPLVGIHRAWYRIRERADLPDLRLHDLRHGWASLAASSGLSLPIIGAVLGHAQPGTTARYAHFLAEPLRQAVDMVSGKIAKAMSQPPAASKVTALSKKG